MEIMLRRLPMLAFLKFQPNPFRFLLYTEWIMLGSCGSFALVEAIKNHSIPFQHILILLALWAMGLMLPVGSRTVKLLYTLLEIGLIFGGAMLGYLHILPMLYLIVTIRSCFLFNPPGRWVVAGFTFFLFLLHQIRYVENIAQLVAPEYQQRFWMHLVGETLMFGLGLFLVLKLANALLSERKLREQLVATHEQLRQYAHQAEDLAASQERNRIARDIHDSLGHALTALNVQLQAAAMLWRHDPNRVEPFLEQAQRLGAAAIQEVRKSVSALREDAQPEQPFTEAIENLVDDFRQGTGIETILKVDIENAIPTEVENTVFRIVQEALTNIYKHAQATAVEVELKRQLDVMQVRVTDNGCGFHRNGSQNSGYGLQGMQERIERVKGKLDITTELDGGCEVKVEIPLASTATAQPMSLMR